MLTWIPIIGPIIQGLTSIFSKWQDTKLATLKVNRESDIEEGHISQQIIHDTKDDIALRFMRDLTIFPVVIWSVIIGWDTIIGARNAAGNLFHPTLEKYMFVVAKYPDSVAYLPYAVMVFLLGNIGINMWSRR